MKIRDRIKEFRRVKASELMPNPKNWRTHPQEQRDALKGVLAEVGMAGAVLARETETGDLMLIDGHLRVETTGDAEIPVLVLDVNEAEADLLLATHDPLGAMAEIDPEKLESVLSELNTSSDALRDMLEQLAAEAGIVPEDETETEGEQVPLKSGFEIVVTCENEQAQQQLFDRLNTEGYKCRVLTY
jgi:ParB-like chromosome segregation protein Spo0J